MSFEHVAIVMNHSRSTGTARCILIGIASHQGDGGAWPSMATLAKYANVTHRNAQVAIKRLISLGEIRVFEQQGGNHNTPEHLRTNRYEVMLQCPPWCDHSPRHRDTRGVQTQLPSLWINPLSESTP
ncbi:MAG: helix-turn-helix domain-containing protein, partial [Propionibacteriaceae bacterium]